MRYAYTPYPDPMLVCVCCARACTRRFVPNLAMSSFMDATPAFARKLATGWYCFFTLVGLALVESMILFDLVAIEEIHFTLGTRKLSTLSLASTAVANLMILGIRQIWTLARHPMCFVLIQSKLQ